MSAREMSLTDSMIRTLRAEAIEASDYEQIAICDLALDGSIDCDDYTTLSQQADRRLRGMSQEDAWAECAEAIESARASVEVAS